MIEVKGIYNNKEFIIKWHNGKITGDDEIVKKAILENKKDHGFLGEPPEFATYNYLNSKIPAYYLLTLYVFDKVLEIKSNIKPRKDNVIY